MPYAAVFGLDSVTKPITPLTPISGVRSYLTHHAKLAWPRVCVRVWEEEESL